MSDRLVDILAPDPYPVDTLLRDAVACARVDGRSQAQVARDAGIEPAALYRALREGSEARPGTVRAVLRACGCRLELREEGET